MDRESVNRLRFDTRLARRRDWVGDREVEEYLEGLPDVAQKMATVGELEAENGAASGEEAGGAPPAPAGSAGETAGFGGADSV
jgi:hypothetical protein